MNDIRDPHFVYDGYERACSAALQQIEKIRAEVALEFAERLASAGWFARVRLKREMQREIERRIDRMAPPWGLYFSA